MRLATFFAVAVGVLSGGSTLGAQTLPPSDDGCSDEECALHMLQRRGTRASSTPLAVTELPPPASAEVESEGPVETSVGVKEDGHEVAETGDEVSEESTPKEVTDLAGNQEPAQGVEEMGEDDEDDEDDADEAGAKSRVDDDDDDDEDDELDDSDAAEKVTEHDTEDTVEEVAQQIDEKEDLEVGENEDIEEKDDEQDDEDEDDEDDEDEDEDEDDDEDEKDEDDEEDDEDEDDDDDEDAEEEVRGEYCCQHGQGMGHTDDNDVGASCYPSSKPELYDFCDDKSICKSECNGTWVTGFCAFNATDGADDVCSTELNKRGTGYIYTGSESRALMGDDCGSEDTCGGPGCNGTWCHYVKTPSYD